MPNTLNLGHDYAAEGQDADVRLLRGVAMGGKHSVEIQLLLDSQMDSKAGYQALALLLTDISLDEQKARTTFERLRAHQNRLRAALNRPVGIKSAAMDFLENIELALGLKQDEQALTYTQLAQMAFRDDLTGLSNFRYFMRRFNEETKRAERYRHLLSTVMIDIDYFKNFNDTHGHMNGNLALGHLAEILRAEVRETDLVARYGGEEFVILLPETTKHEARELAERIRARVQDTPVALESGHQPLSVSLGVATFPRDARSSGALLAAADEALYAAKEGGRNRVCEFQPKTFADFVYKPETGVSAHTVMVAGAFNGWDKRVDRMHRDESGAFYLRVHLVPGRYAYKFLLDGELYIADPRCTEFAVDGYGGRNSVVLVM